MLTRIAKKNEDCEKRERGRERERRRERKRERERERERERKRERKRGRERERENYANLAMLSMSLKTGMTANAIPTPATP